MSLPIKVVEGFEKEDFLGLAKKQTHPRGYARLLGLHHIQKGDQFSTTLLKRFNDNKLINCMK